MNSPLSDKLVEEAREEARDEAATFVLTSLAKLLGVENWTIQDGTEEWEGDVSATLYHILVEGDVVNDWDNSVARHAALTASTDETKALREALEPFAKFADPRGRFPEDMVITSGSSFALRQLTMGDCYTAAAALTASTDETKAREPCSIEDAFQRAGEVAANIPASCHYDAALKDTRHD